MELCRICQNKMARITRATDVPIIEYQCVCGTVAATALDSLIMEDYVGDRDLDQKYENSLDQVAQMPSRYSVKQNCPDCNMDFMTLLFRGASMKSEMRCSVCHARAEYSGGLHT